MQITHVKSWIHPCVLLKVREKYQKSICLKQGKRGEDDRARTLPTAVVFSVIAVVVVSFFFAGMMYVGEFLHFPCMQCHSITSHPVRISADFSQEFASSQLHTRMEKGLLVIHKTQCMWYQQGIELPCITSDTNHYAQPARTTFPTVKICSTMASGHTI